MDFSWSPEQLELRNSMEEFARQQLAPLMAGGTLALDDFRRAWSLCADYGIQRLGIPAAYGGSGADALTLAAALEALGAGCPDQGLLFSLHIHMWTCQMPLLEFGTAAQRDRYLPGMLAGQVVGAQAMSEPEAGSDIAAMGCKARRLDEGWVIDGVKTYLTNSPVADLFVVFAVSRPGGRIPGLTAFLVERGTKGLEIGGTVHKLGLNGSPMGEITLENCWVPDTQLLGRPHLGAAVFQSAMTWARTLIVATSVGAMRRQFENAVKYARHRRQSGRPIVEQQAVAHRLVDMYLRLEAAQLILFKHAWLRATGQPDPAGPSITKLYISETFAQSSLDAMRTYGAAGYLAGSDPERDVSDALGGLFYGGTSDIQRNRIAKDLLSFLPFSLVTYGPDLT